MNYKETISKEFCYCDTCLTNENHSYEWGYEYKKCERTAALVAILKTKRITKGVRVK